MVLKRSVLALGPSLALLAALAACSQKMEQSDVLPAAAESAAAPTRTRAAVAEDQAAADSGSVTAVSAAEQIGSSAATYGDAERKFIRTAKARFAVKDVYASALGIEDAVASHGGFVVSNGIVTDNLHTTSHPIGDGKLLELKEYTVKGDLTVRVPSARTQEFLRAIVGHIAFLDSRQFTARDAQLDLLRQQLEAMRNQETQSELGDAAADGGKLAPRVDAITARNQTKAARDEAILARKTFEDQVAFATIELELYQPSRVLKTERVDVDAVLRAHQPGFFPRLVENLKSGWDGVLEVVLVVMYVWPLALAGVVIGTLVWRARRRVKRAPPAA